MLLALLFKEDRRPPLLLLLLMELFRMGCLGGWFDAAEDESDADDIETVVAVLRSLLDDPALLSFL